MAANCNYCQESLSMLETFIVLSWLFFLGLILELSPASELMKTRCFISRPLFRFEVLFKSVKLGKEAVVLNGGLQWKSIRFSVFFCYCFTYSPLSIPKTDSGIKTMTLTPLACLWFITVYISDFPSKQVFWSHSTTSQYFTQIGCEKTMASMQVINSSR